MTSGLKGCYRDVVTDVMGKVRSDTGWRSNLIVENCDRLLAAMMKRHEGLQGILYLSVGEGQDEWDAAQPTITPSNSKLNKELLRRPLEADQIAYLEGQNQEPTNHLEITAEFHGADLVSNSFQSLREFGLFGGNATEAPDSGFMINYVIHPRIDLTPEVTLIRRVRLKFNNTAAA